MKRILMIDDDPDDRSIFHDALKSLNIDVQYITAEDGQEALDMISKPDFLPPDMIFVDLYMPKLNGYDFVIEMRKMAWYKHIPTYIYTSNNSAHERVNCLTAGATGYVVKQFRDADLAKELQNIIPRYNASA